MKHSKQNIKKFGDTAKQANDKATKASQQLQQKTGLTGKEVNHLSEKLSFKRMFLDETFKTLFGVILFFFVIELSYVKS